MKKTLALLRTSFSSSFLYLRSCLYLGMAVARNSSTAWRLDSGLILSGSILAFIA